MLGNEDEMIDEDEQEEKAGTSVIKTKEELTKDTADKLVKLQVNKLGAKIDYLEEYERIINLERRQLDMLQQSVVLERVEFAYSRAELARQSQPVVAEPQMPAFDAKEPPGYFDFGYPAAGFNAEDLYDLGGHEKLDMFTKDSF